MATVNLTWTPASGGNSTGQQVQRKTSTTNFAIIATLGAAASSYSDTTAQDNVLYTYQIVNLCEFGGIIDSSDVTAAKVVCPVGITATVTSNDVTVSLPSLANDVVYDNISVAPSGGGANVFTQTLSGQAAQTININDLAWNSSFVVTVRVRVGTYTLNCTVNATIGAEPSCAIPTNVVAVIQSQNNN